MPALIGYRNLICYVPALIECVAPVVALRKYEAEDEEIVHELMILRYAVSVAGAGE